jgi:hypothetical protein
MVNHKKIDEKDLVFINTSPAKEEDKAFSEFLKKKKTAAEAKKKEKQGAS